MKLLRHAILKDTGTDAEVFLVQPSPDETLVLVSANVLPTGQIEAVTYTYADSRMIDPDDETNDMDELFDLLCELGGMQGRKTEYFTTFGGAVPIEYIFDIVDGAIEQYHKDALAEYLQW
jgi:hypothetical protein